MKFEKGFRQFLVKTALFVGLFMAFIVLIGTKLYQYDILSGWKIEIWGRVGYILLFSIAGFILLYRKKLLKLNSFKYKIKDFLLLILSFILLIGFYLFEINAYKIPLTLINIILVHILGVSIFLFLALGVYGLDFIKKSIKDFKKELRYFLLFGIITASLMNLVWKSWKFFSIIVLKANVVLLNLVNADFRIIEPDIIIVRDFGAKIAEACSGVYSIFLFSALYLFIIFVDWKKINKKKAIALFIPAVAGAFFVNILRVLMLFLVGGYISEEVAMGLYHSYTGMIFFLLYFAIFWFLFYKWMKDEKTTFIPKDSLYRNSLYLMISTFIMSVFGFVFWMINARLFTTEQVGLATAIISIMGLITSFSFLGLNIGLIRYLPIAKKENKNKKINTSLTLTALTTIVITTIFLLCLNIFSPKLYFIKENMILAFSFIFFMIMGSFNSIIDSVFIAYRNTKYTLMKNSIFSILKIFVPFTFVGFGFYGAYAIFGSYMIALVIGLSVAFTILIKKFEYKPKIVFYDSIIRKIGKYSFGNYIAGFIGGLPYLVLPLIITQMINPETTAYYYMAMMIAALLFAIPLATTQSLFAESSYNEKKLKQQIKKSIKIISALLIPGIIITIFFGKYILLLFGQDYSQNATLFLQILALSGIFVSINQIYFSIFKVKKKIKEMLVINIIGAIVLLGLTYLMIINGFGLLGIAIAWIIGRGFVSLSFVVSAKIKKVR